MIRSHMCAGVHMSPGTCTATRGVNQAACSVTLCLIPLGQDFLLSESHAGGYHTPVTGVYKHALVFHLGSVLNSGPSAYKIKCSYFLSHLCSLLSPFLILNCLS